MAHHFLKPIRLTVMRSLRMHASCLLAAFSALSVTADTTLNPYARLAMLKNTGQTPDIRIKSARSGTGSFTPLILKLDDASATLPDYVHEMHRRGNLVLANVEDDRLNDLSEWPSVSRIEANIAALPSLDKAKEFCHLPDIQHPEFSPVALTGEGVVTGFCDIGFDPAHINFLDSEGRTRVKKIARYALDRSDAEIIDTEDDIRQWLTDNPDETHATHVAGIMSGSYSADNLHGIATKADIVATTSPLYDAYLLDGCEQIIEYANRQMKPAVINMSISSATGPHDGTTLFNQYMEMIARETTVCISAGNSGHRPGYISHTTTDSNPTFRSYIREWSNINPLYADGAVDIWSDSENAFSISIVGRNMLTGELTYRWTYDMHDRPESSTNTELIVCSQDLADSYPGHAPELLPERISGLVYVTSELNPENDRFNTLCYFNFKDMTTDDPYAAEWAFGVEITGHPGQKIQMFSSTGIYLLPYNDPLGMSGDTQCNVNDFCMGNGPVSVGSMNSRASCPLTTGQTLTNNRLHIGEPSYFSSFGTFGNGTALPHICAPGAYVISSLSTPYITQHPELAGSTSHMLQTDGQTYYWGADQGTSMSSPFVAGTFALWLQANPSLTPEEIKQIAIETASPPACDPDNPQWGHGVLNVEAGLKKALSLAGISTGACTDSTAGQLAVKHISPHDFAIYCGGRTIRRTALYDMTGTKVMETYPSDISTELQCGHLGKAIYIIEVEDNSGICHSSRIAVR